MKTVSYFFMILLLLVWSCSKDDAPKILDNSTDPMNNPDPDPSNQAPNPFELVPFEDPEGSGIDPKPTFIWKSTTDPDGDAISYDLYIDTVENASVLIASDISDTTYTLSAINALSLAKEYYWKVVAKDGRGGETSTENSNFKVQNLNDAQQVTSFGFPEMKRHASVVTESIWVLGGDIDEQASNIVGISANDGKNWLTPENLTAPEKFSQRNYHDAVAFKDKIWVLGGATENGFTNNVSCSADGTGWFTQDLSIDDMFTPRAEHTATLHNDKLWVIGGSTTGGEKLADVWISEDGFVWENIIEEAEFGKRNFHQTVSFQGKLWIIGGYDDIEPKNDVWSSIDGINWESETDNASFSARGFHKALVFDNKIWIIGGADENGAVSDIWYSENGINWIDATPENAFPANSEFTSVFYNNKIFVLGGSIGSQVWSIDYHEYE